MSSHTSTLSILFSPRQLARPIKPLAGRIWVTFVVPFMKYFKRGLVMWHLIVLKQHSSRLSNRKFLLNNKTVTFFDRDRREEVIKILHLPLKCPHCCAYLFTLVESRLHNNCAIQKVPVVFVSLKQTSATSRLPRCFPGTRHFFLAF